MRYVCSDIHGQRHLFEAMLQLINFGPQDTLYILGDVVDRGPDPMGILDLIMNNRNMTMLLGNHEEWFLTALRNPLEFPSWFQHGGRSTLDQWESLTASKRQEVVNFLETRPLWQIINEYVLVHAGVQVTPENERLDVTTFMQQQRRQDLLWSREQFYRFRGLPNHTVIFGHTPTLYLYDECEGRRVRPLTIWHEREYFDKIGIDCGAPFREGRLACLRLDDMQEFYV